MEIITSDADYSSSQGQDNYDGGYHNKSCSTKIDGNDIDSEQGGHNSHDCNVGQDSCDGNDDHKDGEDQHEGNGNKDDQHDQDDNWDDSSNAGDHNSAKMTQQ